MEGTWLFSIISIWLCLGLILSAGAAEKSNKGIGVIVVDVQGDFTTWKNGSLAVNGTDKAFIDKLQKATESLKEKGYLIYATQDWHPKDSISFFNSHEGKKPLETIGVGGGRIQILWPPHCVQDTEGAKILLDAKLFKAIVKKGMNKNFDSYSGFEDDGGAKTGMDEILKKDRVKEVIVYGIAMDYCVKATAIHAVKVGYKVTVIDDLTARITPETAEKAVRELKDASVILRPSL
jgi:nicotinamidase/pyrazinamidase